MRKKDFKLFADENIGDDFINHLRECKISGFKDIKTVRSEVLSGQPDDIILQWANENRRFLLTHDKSDFYNNDRLYPFKGLHGIIAMSVHKDGYPCDQLRFLSLHEKEALIGKKFHISQNSIWMKYQDADGRVKSEELDDEECRLCYPDEEPE